MKLLTPWSNRIAMMFTILARFRGVPLLILVSLAAMAGSSAAQQLQQTEPRHVHMDAQWLANIDRVVQQGLDDGEMSGCVVAVGRTGHLVWLEAYGHRQIEPEAQPMTVDALFDLASLTKPIATATSVMILVERGEIRLRDRISQHLPEFAAHDKQSITVQQLLTHQGGLIPDNALADYQDGPEEAFRRIYDLKLYAKPGERFVYTDVGFIVLAKLVERVSGQPIDEFARDHIFAPLKMESTSFNPPEAWKERAVATGKRDDQWLSGTVHDPRAHLLGGVAGHAGLFSTATDLARYAQMMLNRGTLGGQAVLSFRGVETMTADYPVNSGIRGLGWDKRSGYSSNRGELLTDSAFGHGGFTGTSIWIDPDLDLFVIFLSSRLHPDGKGSVNNLAGRIGTIAAASIIAGPDDQRVLPGARDSAPSP